MQHETLPSNVNRHKLDVLVCRRIVEDERRLAFERHDVPMTTLITMLSATFNLTCYTRIV